MSSVKNRSRRLNRPWTQYETYILKKAVEKYGKKWAIIEKEYPVFKNNKRTQVDLKDKYRNLLRPKSPRKSRKLTTNYKSKEKNYEYIIYGLNTCPYCKDSKNLLDINDIKYAYIEIENENQKEKLYKLIDKKTNNYRYFPIIFKNGKFLGGYTELKKQF